MDGLAGVILKTRIRLLLSVPAVQEKKIIEQCRIEKSRYYGAPV